MFLEDEQFIAVCSLQREKTLPKRSEVLGTGY